MKVRELVIALLNQDLNAEVILAKDGEGNGYSPLADISPGKYDPDTTWSGEFHSDVTIGDEDFSQPSHAAVAAVCLGPVN